MEADFPGHSMLLLYRDRIREILAREGMESARAAGLAATGRPMPAGVPVEIYVTIAGAHDWSSTDLRRVDQEVADLIGHPVVITHCPPGQERLLPGEEIWRL